jgi:N-methylhydantoinase A
VELINLRLIAVGVTEKPAFNPIPFAGESPEKAFKKERPVYLPSENKFCPVAVYDALQLEYGNRVRGPAILEQVNTTAFITPEYDVIVDRYGSYCVYARELENDIVKRIMSA